MALNPKQIKAIELLVDGLEKKDVAKSLCVSPRTIRRWSWEKDFLDELVAATSREYIFNVPEARKRELALMRKADNDSVSLKASDNIQGRAGLKAPEKVDMAAEIDTYAHEDPEALIRAGEAIIAGLGRRTQSDQGDAGREKLGDG